MARLFTARHFYVLLALAAVLSTFLFAQKSMVSATWQSANLLLHETEIEMAENIPYRQTWVPRGRSEMLQRKNGLQRAAYLLMVLKNGGNFEVNSQPFYLSALPPEEVRQLAFQLAQDLESIRADFFLTSSAARPDSPACRQQVAAAWQLFARLQDALLAAQQYNGQQQLVFGLFCWLGVLSVMGVLAWYYMVGVQRPVEASFIKLQRFLQLPGAKRLNLYTLKGMVGQLLKSMDEAASFARSTGDGRYNETLSGSIASTGLGAALQEMQHNLAGISVNEVQRTWKIAGLSQLADLVSRLQSQQVATDVLLLEFVKAICQRTESNQGAVFVTRKKAREQVLQLEACYAYNKKRFLSRDIKVTDGLPGQCFQEQRTLYFEEIPENYVLITSGLGEATPSSLLMVPLVANGEVLGIFEMAAFHPLQPHQISFVESACEKLSITLSITKMNEETRKLLDNSREMNRQLQHKEEQMIKYNEQLTKEFGELNNKIKVLEQQANTTDLVEETREEITMLRAELSSKNEIVKVYRKMIDNHSSQLEQARHETESLKRIHTKDLEKLGQAEAHLQHSLQKEQELDAAFELEVSKNQAIAEEVQQLRDKNNYFEILMDAVERAVPVCEMDMKGNILKVNMAWERKMGYKASEITGCNESRLLGEDIEEKQKHQLLWQELQNARPCSGTFKRLSEKGRMLRFSGRYTPLANDRGKPFKVIQLIYQRK